MGVEINGGWERNVKYLPVASCSKLLFLNSGLSISSQDILEVIRTPKFTSFIKNAGTLPVIVAQQLEWKVWGWFLVKGWYLGCRLIPGLTQGTCQRQPMHVSLSLTSHPSLTSTLYKSMEKNSLWWGLTNKQKDAEKTIVE